MNSFFSRNSIAIIVLVVNNKMIVTRKMQVVHDLGHK